LVHWTKAKEDGNHSLVSFFWTRFFSWSDLSFKVIHLSKTADKSYFRNS
jgi:hypothetical protein